MKKSRFRFRPVVAAVALGLGGAAVESHAVRLSADGTGQALIYPYYTTRTVDGGAFNTYLSVATTNNVFEAKALKVHVREGRAGRSVLELNVYLSFRDMWTAAIVPDAAGGARLITADSTCTNPPIPAGGILLANLAYTDGRGDGVDRTREGYVEIIEMGKLTGTSANSASLSAGTPINCPALQGPSVTLRTIEAPTGGLSGTATLINVGQGLDASYDATALDDLASGPLYSDPGTGGTDFDHPAIVPVSTVAVGRYVYRSRWSNARDAVSAALMTAYTGNEFVLDSVTRSNTDWVVTLPTRRLHVSGSAGSPPFGRRSTAIGVCETAFLQLSSRNGVAESFVDHPELIQVDDPQACWATTVIPIRNAAAHMPVNPTRSGVLGSVNGLRRTSDVNVEFGIRLTRAPLIENGWGFFSPTFPDDKLLVSLPDSTRTDQRTGDVLSGPHSYHGLPVAGFAVRTFENGLLDCGGLRCQGNYGSAFNHRRHRLIGPFF